MGARHLCMGYHLHCHWGYCISIRNGVYFSSTSSSCCWSCSRYTHQFGCYDFLPDFVNKKYTVTPFFSKAMYTSYLVQMVTVYAAIKCWFLIVGVVGSDGILINLAGLIFTSMLGLVFTWTLGYAIVSIPGFSQVL